CADQERPMGQSQPDASDALMPETAGLTPATDRAGDKGGRSIALARLDPDGGALEMTFGGSCWRVIVKDRRVVGIEPVKDGLAAVFPRWPAGTRTKRRRS